MKYLRFMLIAIIATHIDQLHALLPQTETQGPGKAISIMFKEVFGNALALKAYAHDPQTAAECAKKLVEGIGNMIEAAYNQDIPLTRGLTLSTHEMRSLTLVLQTLINYLNSPAGQQTLIHVLQDFVKDKNEEESPITLSSITPTEHPTNLTQELVDGGETILGCIDQLTIEEHNHSSHYAQPAQISTESTPIS